MKTSVTVNGEELTDRIYESICSHQVVLFSDLIIDYPEHFRGGERSLIHPDYENLIIWSGIHESGSQAIQSLLVGQAIDLIVVDSLLYALCNVKLPLPIADHIQRYESPHWLPVCFRAKPSTICPLEAE